MTAAVRRWGQALATARSDVVRVGYLGSYARGDWGVGSDVDLLVVVKQSDLPFETRPAGFDTTTLPVPADLFVYTLAEWQALTTTATRFARVLRRDTVWV